MIDQKKNDINKAKKSEEFVYKYLKDLDLFDDVLLNDVDGYDGGFDILVHNGDDVIKIDVKAHEKPEKVEEFLFVPIEVCSNNRKGWIFEDFDMLAVVNNFDYDKGVGDEIIFIKRSKILEMIQKNNYKCRFFKTEAGEFGNYIMVKKEDIKDNADHIYKK